MPRRKHMPFEYDQVTEHIYVGTNQCCIVHFDESLLEAGIRADISLEQERLDTPFGVDFFYGCRLLITSHRI